MVRTGGEAVVNGRLTPSFDGLHFTGCRSCDLAQPHTPRFDSVVIPEGSYDPKMRHSLAAPGPPTSVGRLQASRTCDIGDDRRYTTRRRCLAAAALDPLERTNPDAVIGNNAKRATKRQRRAASTRWGIQSSGMAAMTKRSEW